MSGEMANINPTPLEALEKIDHTICLNNLAKNIVWNIDKEEKCDCESIEQFVDCYDVIEKELEMSSMAKKLLKAMFVFDKECGIFVKKVSMNDETKRKLRDWFNED